MARLQRTSLHTNLNLSKKTPINIGVFDQLAIMDVIAFFNCLQASIKHR